jgi:hypothetical protein
MASLLVMGHIHSLPVPRRAMSHIGTIDLEHLFGVTRHGTHANNRADKILRRFVKADFVTPLAEKWGLVLRHKCHRNIGGVSDDIAHTSDLNNLFDALSRPHIAQTLFEVFLRTAPTPAAFEVDLT